jgi:hypothetical protein
MAAPGDLGREVSSELIGRALSSALLAANAPTAFAAQPKLGQVWLKNVQRSQTLQGFNRQSNDVYPRSRTASELADRLQAEAPRKLLAIDGGGIRGILSLSILAKIE